jgi:hypothetical protein
MESPCYLIVQGVHRSVAAREVGLEGVLARIPKIGIRVIPMTNLFSPKPSIGRWDRGRDFQDLVSMMSSTEGRSRMSPVEVEEISERRAKRFTQLLEVKIEDVEESS